MSLSRASSVVNASAASAASAAAAAAADPYMPSLLSLLVFDPSLGPHEDDQHEKILYYWPANAPMDDQLRDAGVYEGIINFCRNFSTTEPCHAIHTNRRRVVLLEPEPGIWFVMSVRLRSSPPPAVSPVKGNSNETRHANDQIIENDITGRQLEVNDTLLQSILRQLYAQFKFLHGSLRHIRTRNPSIPDDVAHLRLALNRGLSSFVMHHLADPVALHRLLYRDIRSLLPAGGIDYQPMRIARFVQIHCVLADILTVPVRASFMDTESLEVPFDSELDFQDMHLPRGTQTVVMWDNCMVSSSLEFSDTALLFGYIHRRLSTQEKPQPVNSREKTPRGPLAISSSRGARPPAAPATSGDAKLTSCEPCALPSGNLPPCQIPGSFIEGNRGEPNYVYLGPDSAPHHLVLYKMSRLSLALLFPVSELPNRVPGTSLLLDLSQKMENSLHKAVYSLQTFGATDSSASAASKPSNTSDLHYIYTSDENYAVKCTYPGLDASADGGAAMPPPPQDILTRNLPLHPDAANIMADMFGQIHMSDELPQRIYANTQSPRGTGHWLMLHSSRTRNILVAPPQMLTPSPVVDPQAGSRSSSSGRNSGSSFIAEFDDEIMALFNQHLFQVLREEVLPLAGRDLPTFDEVEKQLAALINLLKPMLAASFEVADIRSLQLDALLLDLVQKPIQQALHEADASVASRAQAKKWVAALAQLSGHLPAYNQTFREVIVLATGGGAIELGFPWALFELLLHTMILPFTFLTVIQATISMVLPAVLAGTGPGLVDGPLPRVMQSLFHLQSEADQQIRALFASVSSMLKDPTAVPLPKAVRPFLDAEHHQSLRVSASMLAAVFAAAPPDNAVPIARLVRSIFRLKDSMWKSFLQPTVNSDFVGLSEVALMILIASRRAPPPDEAATRDEQLPRFFANLLQEFARRTLAICESQTARGASCSLDAYIFGEIAAHALPLDEGAAYDRAAALTTPIDFLPRWVWSQSTSATLSPFDKIRTTLFRSALTTPIDFLPRWVWSQSTSATLSPFDKIRGVMNRRLQAQSAHLQPARRVALLLAAPSGPRPAWLLSFLMSGHLAATVASCLAFIDLGHLLLAYSASLDAVLNSFSNVATSSLAEELLAR
ncbi:hypothetical protein H696_01575 [Fonticula alba]|uniref:CCZ1/INTU/HSP4 first Longin domain-containing protein n=1 Tax=Fonticula alba TaxID=691883 RepID=A0A058ZE21_FONAL|nr:hypothetical protein H696_01575 [Fonticula alba]KCV72173.1 hypothetical protein H696_01575 [Fonticula alba]|eukprot:XP_009493751.1 hypothetical protein H696_01575 [Fonticula alba]